MALKQIKRQRRNEGQKGRICRLWKLITYSGLCKQNNYKTVPFIISGIGFIDDEEFRFWLVLRDLKSRGKYPGCYNLPSDS